MIDGQLRGRDDGTSSTVLDDFQEVGRLIVTEWSQQEVVENDDVGARERGHHASQSPVGPGDAEVVEQSGHAHVERAVSVADGIIGQRAGNERLADARRSDDHHAVVVVHPG